MSVQVMSIRKFQIDKIEKLNSLLGELSSHSKKQPGYISRETLRSLENPGEYLVRSEWEAAEYWDKWLHSKERRDIQGKIDSIIGEKTFYEVFEPVSH
ncbi:MAG: antibiotic biosynthesis monooxygenase family protein [Desulfobacteraceae bacterium]|jgi:heme-degrading monooxygenase HmoA|nr:antibiotic biosynthesis monooxygenase family protein [Desulfobacteraceae bacterium]